MDPVVRVGRGYLRTRVVAGYVDHLLTGTVFGAFRPTERLLRAEGEPELAGRLSGLRRLDYADLTGGRVRRGWRGTLRVALRPRGGRPIRFRLPRSQSGRLLALLGLEAPPARDRALLWRRAIGLTLLAIGMLFGVAGTRAALARDAWVVPAVSGTIGWIVALSGVRLLFTRRRGRSLERGPRPAREPFRSRPVGWLLKSAGVVYWLLIGANFTTITAWFGPLEGKVAVLIWVPAALLIYWGHRVGLRSYRPDEESHERPVLFLRSFADDGQVSLQPGSTTLRVGGRPIMAEQLAYNPIGLIRMLLGRGGTSAEESLTRFFAPIGPVVAIGKPGERLRTGGAARFYVDDASWQAAVESELARARIVVLQPGAGAGIEWELETVRRDQAPEPELLSLAPFTGDAEAFDRVAPMLESTLGATLPRRIPFLGAPAFVTFDAEWRPVVHQLSYKNPLWWPLAGDATDLRYTLRPFLEGLDPGPRAAPPLPRPARWGPGPGRSVVAAVGGVLGASVMIGSIVLVGLLMGVPLRGDRCWSNRWCRTRASRCPIGSASPSPSAPARHPPRRSSMPRARPTGASWWWWPPTRWRSTSAGSPPRGSRH
ncbi:MAG: hypothetical protein R2909_21715 [Gemmatimonadales bacterium]